MKKYKEAAEMLLKRLLGIYGAERVELIAASCGYKLDASGKVISVVDEEKAFELLERKVETELGPIAVIGTKIALRQFLAQEERAEIEHAEALREIQLMEVTEVMEAEDVNENMNRGFGVASAKGGGDFRQVLADCMLTLDSEYRIIEATGPAFKEHIPPRAPVIGRKVCDLFTKPFQACIGIMQPVCPVKESIDTMSNLELEMPVNGRLLKWSFFPYLGMERGSERVMLHISDVTPEGLCAV